MNSFVCDFGFSSAKWLYGDKKGRVISVYQDRVEKSPLVGEDALDNPGGVAYIRTPQHLVKYYPVFLDQCLNDAEVEGKVNVAVGLPAQFFEEQRKLDGGAISTLKKSLLSTRVADVVVLPQGIGGIRSYLVADEGRMKEGLVLGIDIGFNTIIYTLYDPKRYKVLFTDTLYKRGISQLAANYLMPRICDFTSGLSMTPVEIARLMEVGYLTVGTDKHDLMPEIKSATQDYLNNILVEIMEDVKANISVTRPLESILFYGGGATHLKGRVESGAVDVKVLDEPEYANARGFKSFLAEG